MSPASVTLTQPLTSAKASHHCVTFLTFSLSFSSRDSFFMQIFTVHCTGSQVYHNHGTHGFVSQSGTEKNRKNWTHTWVYNYFISAPLKNTLSFCCFIFLLSGCSSMYLRYETVVQYRVYPSCNHKHAGQHCASINNRKRTRWRKPYEWMDYSPLGYNKHVCSRPFMGQCIAWCIFKEKWWSLCSDMVVTDKVSFYIIFLILREVSLGARLFFFSYFVLGALIVCPKGLLLNLCFMYL